MSTPRFQHIISSSCLSILTSLLTLISLHPEPYLTLEAPTDVTEGDLQTANTVTVSGLSSWLRSSRWHRWPLPPCGPLTFPARISSGLIRCLCSLELCVWCFSSLLPALSTSTLYLSLTTNPTVTPGPSNQGVCFHVDHSSSEPVRAHPSPSSFQRVLLLSALCHLPNHQHFRFPPFFRSLYLISIISYARLLFHFLPFHLYCDCLSLDSHHFLISWMPCIHPLSGMDIFPIKAMIYFCLSSIPQYLPNFIPFLKNIFLIY